TLSPPSAGEPPFSSLKPNQVGETSLYGQVPLVSMVKTADSACSCWLTISNTLLKSYSYNEIHNRRVALGITCVQCTPVQLEILRRAGAMPISSRRCGMITKRALSRAKCIKCGYCGLYFSPNKFIFHSHRAPDSKYTQPDAANFNSWRRHLRLSDPSASDDLAHSWEDVKAMFNGGTRKRAFPSPASSSSGGGSARQHLELPPPRPAPARNLRSGTGQGRRGSFPLSRCPAELSPVSCHKIARHRTPLPPPPYGFPAFGLCAKKDDGGLGEKGALPGVFWPAAPASKDSVYPPFPVSGAARHRGECGEQAGAAPAPQGGSPPSRDLGRSSGQRITPMEARYISAFRPVVKAAESLAKLYGSREVYGPSRPPGYSSPDLLSDTSSYRSASPGPDTADEPEVDVESSRFPEEERGGSGAPGPCSSASSPASARDTEDRREHSPGDSPRSTGGYEVYTKPMAEAPQTLKASTPHQSLPTSYLCSLDPNEQDSEDSHSTAEDLESRKSFQDQRSHISHPSPAHTDRGEDSPIDVTGTQFVEKDIENMAKDELQKLLVEQMDLRKKLEREFQSLKDNFQDQMKRELAYREEMVQQLQIVRDTLCNELDQERKARYAIQQKLKDADTKTLHRELFLQTSNPAPLSYIWAPRKLMYPPAP
ncbi:hypothetical protein GDO81_009392, partial [Engystomops pustulosus]